MAIFGMLLSIAIMIIGAYRGIKAIPLTVLAAAIVMITNGVNLWEGYSVTYAFGFGNVVASYFFIFVSSSVYAKVMEDSGATTAIGYKFIDWFGTKHVMLVSILFVALLTYGGVSLFVVVFAATPILFLLFKEAGLPRHLVCAPYTVGSSTFTMTALPGSPQLTNVIPSQFLGTPLTAAPVLSILLSLLLFGGGWWYCMFAEKQARKKNEEWTYPEGYNKAMMEINRKDLPGTAASFIPIVFVIAFIIICSAMKDTLAFAQDSALLTTIAMCLGTVICVALNFSRLSVTKVKDLIGLGSANAITAMVGLAAVVAYGAVVSSTAAFQDVISWVLGVQMSPYYKGIFATAVIAGITGSSSGGVRIALTNMADYFIGTGCNLEYLHRVMSVAAGSFDTLPHVSGIFLVLAVMGLTHKEAYKHTWWTSVVIPAIVAIIGAVIATIIG
ncbi:GntP family permease [Ruminococcaceae bacterium OttesenSCG-928-O06]|nr:GntP family permease [Ruminococcaceae bacterium OttesenSCG-928-O06]